MAGDWMKVEKSTPDKPEVFAMADILGIDPDAVFGKCFRVWGWFDTNTTNGKANGCCVSKNLIDRLVSVVGFAEAMLNVGWLVSDGTGVAASNFDRHNGETAKQRALTAKRVAKHAEKTNGKANAELTQDPLPREEKRRKEIYSASAHLVSVGVSEPVAKDWLKTRKEKKLATTKTAIEGVIREAEKAGKAMSEIIKICCEQGWGGFKASWLDKLPSETKTTSLRDLPGMVR